MAKIKVSELGEITDLAASDFVLVTQSKEGQAESSSYSSESSEDWSNHTSKKITASNFANMIGGTPIALADDSTTNVVIFDKMRARSAVIEYYIIGASGMRVYSGKLAFFGATAYIEDGGGSYIVAGTDFPGTVTLGADINNNEVRLAVTLADVGEALEMVWRRSALSI